MRRLVRPDEDRPAMNGPLRRLDGRRPPRHEQGMVAIWPALAVLVAVTAATVGAAILLGNAAGASDHFRRSTDPTDAAGSPPLRVLEARVGAVNGGWALVELVTPEADRDRVDLSGVTLRVQVEGRILTFDYATTAAEGAYTVEVVRSATFLAAQPVLAQRDLVYLTLPLPGDVLDGRPTTVTQSQTTGRGLTEAVLLDLAGTPGPAGLGVGGFGPWFP